MPDSAVPAPGRTRLAVLGSPIGHSLSPLLHSAAYGMLGLPWTYEALEVRSDELPAFVSALDGGWRGLSLTMPLKRDILPLLDRVDPVAELTGGANTVLFEDGGLSGFNTDVAGIVRALAPVGDLGVVRVLGAGATAASALVAVQVLGALRVHVSARSASRAAPLLELGRKVGIDVAVHGFDEPWEEVPDLVISTLPGGSSATPPIADAVVAASALFDVAYHPWPSELATRWLAAGSLVVPGIEMLVHQALVQVRIFVHDNPDGPLHDELQVLAAMRASVGLDAG